MAQWKQHIKLEGVAIPESFRKKGRGPRPLIPQCDRFTHGGKLQGELSHAWSTYEERRQRVPSPLDRDRGIFLEITSQPGYPLPEEKLDNQDFDLRHLRKVGDQEVAVVFVPEKSRRRVANKIENYLDPKKDRKGKPSNQFLVTRVAEIKLADTASFWTDSTERLPETPDKKVWLELWIKRRATHLSREELSEALSQNTEIEIGNSALTFFDNYVLLIRASLNDLAFAPELIGSLEELRAAKEPPEFWVELSPYEQHEWVQELLERTQRHAPEATACILDTGINYHHPLLAPACAEERSVSWRPEWPTFDEFDRFNPLKRTDAHGSMQAGVVIYNDLRAALEGQETIELRFDVESGRILPPNGSNPPGLLGQLTAGTASKLEIDRPLLPRVYSLAVTAAPEPISGQPSSWSAEIDQFTSGAEDGTARLFIISAGNNPNVAPNTDHWDQVAQTPIEDPAQAWNALTIGAYTEQTSIRHTTFDGWSPIAEAGDVAPQSSSSVYWEWRDQAPFKPDLVAEGGNCALSPDHKDADMINPLSVLTTSGRTDGALFEYHGDTSAACASITHIATDLRATYPDLWPETIRGLLVHSAEWTPAMERRLEHLRRTTSRSAATATMLRTVGYGVPNKVRAKASAAHALTLVYEDYLQPFSQKLGKKRSDPTLNQMHLIRLPWPTMGLSELAPETKVRLKVTLSYFVEPNPGRRGYRSRYRYQSHGLRFDVIRPAQGETNFRQKVNEEARDESYSGPEEQDSGWMLGPSLRTRGTLHSDTWEGTAADLLRRNTLAVYPIAGWWKYREAEERCNENVRYSLLVSLEVPENSVDIYSEVASKVAVETPATISV
ncbi:S8 family peptidase [Aidingimonas lacisalsi]|uniref:S8 family peptidase n=1 Tax=Aidingimonas lacisalsi TaxID=2604086 RepID=UPI0011D19893|nr:S8 family peptidase [Aidingimonas lacisalsi]